MIRILFTHFNSELAADRWRYYFSKIPISLQQKILCFRRWQDRQACLCGKLLLTDGIKTFGYPSSYLNHLSYNPFGRPFLNHAIDFNITHSGGYVVCAITNQGNLGIDIEKIQPIPLSDFKNAMTPEEWLNIKQSVDPYASFYEYWTIKESVMKADGTGLSMPLNHVSAVGKRQAVFNRKHWFLKEIDLDEAYKCHMAADSEVSDYCIQNVIIE